MIHRLNTPQKINMPFKHGHNAGAILNCESVEHKRQFLVGFCHALSPETLGLVLEIAYMELKGKEIIDGFTTKGNTNAH